MMCVRADFHFFPFKCHRSKRYRKIDIIASLGSSRSGYSNPYFSVIRRARSEILLVIPPPSHPFVNLYLPLQIIGDDTTAIDSVLQADVWRHKLLTEEIDLSNRLDALEKQTNLGEAETVRIESEKDDLTARLGEIQKSLLDMEAETGPARASSLLAGLGFTDEDQKKPTRAFSGGWR